MTRFAILLVLVTATAAPAITVDPISVNVRHSGPTTAFLTFRGLDGQAPVEALWCGELNPDRSCVASTIFGRLPLRSDLSRTSGQANFTDIMTIPSSVSRRAFQEAQRGKDATFFYVRRFKSQTGGPDEFVAVTCRMSGGGARSPLALLDVRIGFASDTPVKPVARGEAPPRFAADIAYNGSGRLKGRWEVVVPGDVPPSTRDLLTEGTLPAEERPLRRRYTLVDRFDVFLPPTGRFTLPGPDPAKLPSGADGLHLVLLRVEATPDEGGGSDTGAGRVASGGVAGFPLPVLRYYVGSGPDGVATLDAAGGELRSLSPEDDAQTAVGSVTAFTWSEGRDGVAYRLEVVSDAGEVLSAVVDRGVAQYAAPPWLIDQAGKRLRWRVETIGGDGAAIGETDWRTIEVVAGAATPAPTATIAAPTPSPSQ